VLSLGGCVYILARYDLRVNLLQLFGDTDGIMRLATLLAMLIGLVALEMTGIAAAQPNAGTGAPAKQAVLRLLACAGTALGLIAGLFMLAIMQQVERRMGPVRFAVRAPSYAQALLCVAIGFLVGWIGFGGAVLLGRRRTREA
jgi:hypothetical protein